VKDNTQDARASLNVKLLLTTPFVAAPVAVDSVQPPLTTA
jgi:hypothetical protein